MSTLTLRIPSWLRITLYAVILGLGVSLGILQWSGTTQISIAGTTITLATLLKIAGYLGIPTGAAALRYLRTDWQPYPGVPIQDPVTLLEQLMPPQAAVATTQARTDAGETLV